MYGNSEHGYATIMNEKRIRDKKSKLEFLTKWHTDWKKGESGVNRTILEEGYARAAEIAVMLRGATPLWTGT